MLDVATMKWTRRRVLRAIRELSRSGYRVTYEEIAAYADCSYHTVRRAVQELENEGKIKRSLSGKRVGYSYEVVRCQV